MKKNISKKKRVSITGLSGVIGKVLVKTLPSNIEITDLYRSKENIKSKKVSQSIPIDLLNKDKVLKALEEAQPELIIHMAAATHIDECEKDRKNGKNGFVWNVNVKGSAIISEFCARNSIPLIFMSTECVFNGKKKRFAEHDSKDPKNWYGVTKSEAEDVILSSGAKTAIVRSVVAYHENDNEKTIFGKLLSPLKFGKKIDVVSDQKFTPTHTYDITNAIKKIIQKNVSGVFHVAPKKSLTPYEFALLIANRYKIDNSKITKTTLEKMYGSKAALLRLENACLIGTKTNKILGIKPKSARKVLRKRNK